jgi:hypothetical protein
VCNVVLRILRRVSSVRRRGVGRGREDRLRRVRHHGDAAVLGPVAVGKTLRRNPSARDVLTQWIQPCYPA